MLSTKIIKIKLINMVKFILIMLMIINKKKTVVITDTVNLRGFIIKKCTFCTSSQFTSVL